MFRHKFKDYWQYYVISRDTPRYLFPHLRNTIAKKRRSLKSIHRTGNLFANKLAYAQDKIDNDREALRDFFQNTTLEEYWAYFVSGHNAPHYHLPWNGREMTKFPADIIIYKDIIESTRPEVIIEIGTQRGVSALFFMSLVKPYGGIVITIDIKQPEDSVLGEFKKEGVLFVHGDATSSDVAMQVRELVGGKKGFVVDDGSHRREDVLKAFDQYQECVPPGGYFVIEDGMTNWLMQYNDFDALGAVDQILRMNGVLWRRYGKYDAFVFFSMYQGILQKVK